MRDELVDFLERSRIEEQIDPLAGGELARLVLPPEPILAAAELGAALEVRDVSVCPCRVRLKPDRSYAFTACAFSQSFRNFSSPMSVSGCLNSASITAAGHVQMSAPIRAASTM